MNVADRMGRLGTESAFEVLARARALERQGKQVTGTTANVGNAFYNLDPKPAAQQSTPANFYQAAPANYYAEFWHENAINGKQYGFPYDDDAGQSSDISVTNPQYMVVAVGW